MDNGSLPSETQPDDSIRAYLAAIVDSSDDAIIGKNLNSIVTSWNRAAERIFGYPADEMIGQPIRKLIPADRQGEEDEIISRIAKGERVDHFETIRVTKQGNFIEVSVTVSAIKNSHGKVIGASKVARDITEAKRIERERERMLGEERILRERAERADQIKNEFVATLSHELRTPLSAILGWSQILRSKAFSPEELRKGLDTIYRNTRIQIRLIEDLLDINRILMGKLRLDLQSMEVSPIIEAAIEAVRPSLEAKKLHLKTAVDPNCGSVRGDPARLQQVVWNLLSNAIKFTPEGGRIEIVLERADSHLELSVRDTGIGIKPEFLGNVFDRFSQADSTTTRRYGGIGLGLSIVKHLVELHGGSVHVKSAGEGMGATFRLTLPLAPVLHGERSPGNLRYSPTATDIAEEWIPPRLWGKNILIVDDDEDTAEVVRHLLQECGAEAVLVSSGKELLSMASSLPEYDVLISDIGMPEMDGFELIKRIRARNREDGGNIAAIALTAFGRPEDRKNAIMAGFDVHLSKPADPQELIALVARFALRDK